MEKKVFIKKVFCVILTVAFICSSSIGCSSDSASKTTLSESAVSQNQETTFGIEPMATRTKLRIGYFAGVQHALPWYIADVNGWFDELNIDIEYSTFTAGPAMCEAINSWDIGTIGGPGAFTGMMSYGVKVIGPCTYDTQLNLYVRPDSPIAKAGKGYLKEYPEIYGTPETWKGSTWLLPIGTTLYKVMASTIEKFGLSLDDITVINMDVTSAQSAFKAGEGDGMAQWATLSGQAEKLGYVRVSGVRGAISDTITCNMVASEDAISNKLELMSKAYELYFRTYEWINNGHQKEAVAFFKESCDDEGILCDEASAQFSVDNLIGFTLEEALAQHDNMKSDPRELAGRQLTQVETDLLETFDFLITIGNYTDENRKFILEQDMITNTVANAVKERMTKR